MRIDRVPNNTRIIVLIITTLISFLVAVTISAVNVALPQIGRELNANAILLGWVATAYFLSSASLLVPFGRLADIHGRRRVFTVGVITFGGASILCAMANSIPWLIGWRVLQGIGGGMVWSTTLAMLTSAYPPGARGQVLGINAASTYVGLSLGPFLGGLLTDHAGWRSIFLVGFALSSLTAIVTLWKLKNEWVEARSERFDYVGSIILATFLVSLIYGLTVLPGMLGVLLLLTCALMGLVFVTWENRTPSPLLDLGLFKNNRTFTFSNAATLISYSATYAVTFLLSLYLQYNKGLSAEMAGLVLVTMPATQCLFSPVAGRLSDRIEPRTLASAGMAITTAGLALLILLSQNTSIAYVLVSLLILGFGLSMFVSPNTNAIMASVGKHAYGVASAAVNTSRQVGTMFSMGICMLMFATFIGRVEITPQYYGAFLRSVRVIFIIFTALSVAGVFASLARGTIRQGASTGKPE